MASDWDWMNTLPAVPDLKQTYYSDYLKSLLFQNMLKNVQSPWGGQAPFDLWNNASWTDDATRGNMKSWLENLGFPMAQYRSNEQQKAFDQLQAIQNMNTTNAMNQFNMGQQNWTNQFQKWMADQQQNQFLKQLGLDTDVATWRYGPNGLEQRALENERYGIDQATARNTATLANNLAVQELINQGDLARQLAMNRGNLDVQGLVNRGNLDVQGLVNSGALSQIRARGTEDRLTQQLLGQQQMEQLKKQLGSQELQSRYQAFGRAQAPNARWTGNW